MENVTNNDPRYPWYDPNEKIMKSLHEQIINASETIAQAAEMDAQKALDKAVITRKKLFMGRSVEHVMMSGSVEKDILRGGSVERIPEYDKAASEAADQAREARAAVNALKSGLLDTHDSFVDAGVSHLEYMSTDHDLSIADYCGRVPINKELASFPVENYSYFDCAEIVEPGGEGSPVDLIDFLSRIKTENDDIIRVFDILNFPESLYKDDRTVITKAIGSAHVKRVINTENSVILAKLTGAKDAIALNPVSVQTALNAHLCGMAKRGAEIWTNSDGFAALDIDVDGISLIRRNGSGDFVYKSKYIVREFPSEIMPNGENGAPVLIGDFKNIVRFGVLSDKVAMKENVFPANIYHRRIVEEIPILTTTSDTAYINGYIAIGK